MSSKDVKPIANVLYHSAVLSAITVAYALILRKTMKFDIGDPSKAGVESMLKLAGTVAAANLTKDYLEKNKILPPDIPI